jgi:hypothetical protein
MTAATSSCEHDIDRGGDVLLRRESDCLARDRAALSVGAAPSDGRGVGVGGVEEGRVMGRKREERGILTVVWVTKKCWRVGLKLYKLLLLFALCWTVYRIGWGMR